MYDIIIIGGGMAGMTSALYSLRNNKSVLIIERESVGGQIAKSAKVENYPTIKEISGTELADQLFDQITDLGVEFALENVLEVSKDNGVFTVTTDYATYESLALIVATGSKPRPLGLEGEEQLVGKGVYYCAICDGPFYAGKEVLLVGDANSALQYALMLSGYCSKVTMVTLFDKLFGEEKVIDRVRSTPNIEIRHNMQALRLLGTDHLQGVVFKDKSSGNEVQLLAPAVFVAIGQLPDNDIFKSLVDIDDKGYIVSDESCTTKCDGLYVAGDCRTKRVRQVTTAVADGAVAAVSACKYVDSVR